MRISLILLLLTGACAIGAARPEPIDLPTALRVACDSYDVTLDALTAAREGGRLSPSQIASVDLGIAMISPVCTAGTLEASEATFNTIVRALGDMLDVKEAAS